MINLIPPQGHTALHHEYVLRVASLYGFILGGILVASAVLTIPTYVLTKSQLEAVQSDNSEMKEIQDAFDVAAEEIRTGNTLVTQLRTDAYPIMSSALIEEIVSTAPSGVTFSTFQGVYEDARLTGVIIQGTAVSRNTLAQFTSNLEASPLFEKADVPIADLARDANLPFAITVTLTNTL